MKRIFPEINLEDKDNIVTKNINNLIFKDKNGEVIKKDSLVIYSERIDHQFNYADALGVLVAENNFLRMHTIIYNSGGTYSILDDSSRSSSDTTLEHHSLEIFQTETNIEIHVKDLKLVKNNLKSEEEMISFMNLAMPLFGVSN